MSTSVLLSKDTLVPLGVVGSVVIFLVGATWTARGLLEEMSRIATGLEEVTNELRTFRDDVNGKIEGLTTEFYALKDDTRRNTALRWTYSESQSLNTAWREWVIRELPESNHDTMPMVPPKRIDQ